MSKPTKPRIPSHIRPKIRQIQGLTKTISNLEKQQERLEEKMRELSREISDKQDARVLLTAALMNELSGKVSNDVIDKVMEQL